MNKSLGGVVGAIAAVVACGASTPALAIDGCKVFLCMAGHWQNIDECRPDVEEALRYVATGRPWPACDMGSGGGANAFTVAQDSCPVFYQMFQSGESGDFYVGCMYPYEVSISINGAPWEDVFFDAAGNTSTRYYDAARTQLGSDIDPTYDNDAARYVPPTPAPAGGTDSPGG